MASGVAQPAASVVLSAQQLNQWELMRAGAYGESLRYELPEAGSPRPVLLADGARVGTTIELLDRESTPVATLAVDAVAHDAQGTWIAGLATFLREATEPAFRELRPALDAERVPHACLLLGDYAEGLTGVVVVVDHGDSEQLVRQVRRLRNGGLDVRVLPRPWAPQLTPGEVDAHLESLAIDAFATSVDVVHGSLPSTGDGVVVLFTGLSGAGKSTIARHVTELLRTETDHRVTLLDGDETRRILSQGLGFTHEDRELNVRRLGWVAALVSGHGGIAVCAPIAPYESMRQEVRAMAQAVGLFVLVYVATPLEVCEASDRKGLYAKARAGEIPSFTGISDPFEPPSDADVTVSLDGEDAVEAAARIFAVIRARMESIA